MDPHLTVRGVTRAASLLLFACWQYCSNTGAATGPTRQGRCAPHVDSVVLSNLEHWNVTCACEGPEHSRQCPWIMSAEPVGGDSHRSSKRQSGVPEDHQRCTSCK